MRRIFVLEEKNNSFDFEYELINSLDYQKWFYRDSNNFQHLFVEEGYFEYLKDIPGKIEHIPVGSLFFVRKFLENKNKKMKKPNFIPESLKRKEFLNRKIALINEATEKKIKNTLKELQLEQFFIKELEEYKGFRGIINDCSVKLPLDYPRNVLLSEKMDIISEYRVFVYKDKLVGINNYSGEFNKLPDLYLIEEMINEYKSEKDRPMAYTLDVAITKEGKTALIEVHPFVSCGLYGFRRYDILPQMMITGYKNIIK